MVKKVYTITIEEDIVNKSQQINSNSGRKLSSVIEILLDKWNKEHEEDSE